MALLQVLITNFLSEFTDIYPGASVIHYIHVAHSEIDNKVRNNTTFIIIMLWTFSEALENAI